jgi:hypothetical protein
MLFETAGKRSEIVFGNFIRWRFFALIRGDAGPRP